MEVEKHGQCSFLIKTATLGPNLCWANWGGVGVLVGGPMGRGGCGESGRDSIGPARQEDAG